MHNYRYNPDEEEWLAEHGYKEYPDDLPVPRRMTHGPHTKEGSIRYLNADFPLPGTFPEPEGSLEGIPAWVKYLEKGEIYPGILLQPRSMAIRQKIVEEFKNSDYSDIDVARRLMEFDRITGFNPLFPFQYAVLNFSRYSEVLIFELNGIPHALHWHNVNGFAIDKEYISDNKELATDDFYLFELVASSLGDESIHYPVIKMLKSYVGSPERFWERISPPLDDRDLRLVGIYDVS